MDDDSPLFGYIGISITVLIAIYFYVPILFWILASIFAYTVVGLTLNAIFPSKNRKHHD